MADSLASPTGHPTLSSGPQRTRPMIHTSGSFHRETTAWTSFQYLFPFSRAASAGDQGGLQGHLGPLAHRVTTDLCVQRIQPLLMALLVGKQVPTSAISTRLRGRGSQVTQGPVV